MKQTFNKTLTHLALVFSVATPALAHAMRDPALCQTQQYQPDIISWIPESPSYFAKVLPSGTTATYIGSGNKLLFLEEPDQAKRILSAPGDVDPVPCPDGKLLTVPGLSIYEMSTVLRDGAAAAPIMTDSDISGVYQSCAVLKTSGNKTTYRIVTDESGEIFYRDYLVEYAATPSTPAKVTKLGTAGPRCRGLNLKTIIISKTGKYLSGYDANDGAMKIFDIHGDTAACKQVYNFGFPTGKLEFNYDDTRVTFHIDLYGSNSGGYFSGVDSSMTKDVFTLDLDTSSGTMVGKNFRRITTSNELGSGSYYPSFMKDGRLIYINDDDGFFSFQTIQPNDVQAADFTLPPPDGWAGGRPPAGTPADWKQRLHSAAIIGSLWADNCSSDPDDISAAQAAAIHLSLSAPTCRALVAKDWSPATADRLAVHNRIARDTRFDAQTIKSTSAQVLDAACGNSPTAPAKTPKVFGVKVLDYLTPKRAVHHYCVGCHTAGGVLRLPSGASIPNPLDFGNLTEDQIARARTRLELPAGGGRMPPGGFEAPAAGGTDHKTLVQQYLDCMLGRVKYTGDEQYRPRCDY